MVGPRTPGRIAEVDDEPRRVSPTLHEVAREAGVSYATASRAFNGSTRNVRPENVARVREAAARLGYTPHLSAQAMARGSSNTAVLILSEIDDPYFSSIAAGVGEAAEQAGLIVTVAVASRSAELELQIVRTRRGQRPRVIVIAGSRIAGSPTRSAFIEELNAYRATGGRVAVISQVDLPFTTFSIDDYAGARRLALGLTGLGYRRFGVIHGGDRIRTSADRRRGFADGLREAGIAVDRRNSIHADLSRDGGRRVARHFADQDVEAVFAVNDALAIGVMTGLRDAGLRPGSELAVAGFDDIPAATQVTPALTSVRVPSRDIGRRAMEAALTRDDAEVVEIAAEVVLRESTPPR